MSAEMPISAKEAAGAASTRRKIPASLLRSPRDQLGCSRICGVTSRSDVSRPLQFVGWSCDPAGDDDAAAAARRRMFRATISAGKIADGAAEEIQPDGAVRVDASPRQPQLPGGGLPASWLRVCLCRRLKGGEAGGSNSLLRGGPAVVHLRCVPRWPANTRTTSIFGVDPRI